MASCTRCGWSAPLGATVCQRCGNSLAPSGPPPRPTLVLRLKSADLPPESWEVTDTPLGIGRLDTSDIAIPHKSVSRQHARILPTPTGFEIEDLGSVNGTWLNDKPIVDRTPLSTGDNLMIGDVVVSVEVRQPPAPVVQAAPPLPVVGGGGAPASGPSTVYYDTDEALAAARPQSEEVPTAFDVTPAKGSTPPPTPAVIVDAPVHSPPVVDQPTLIAADLESEQPGPSRLVAPPPPPPPVEPITPPSRPADFAPAFGPRPAPPREITPPPSFEPQLAPPRDVAAPPPTYEPRPTPPRDVAPPPPPTYEPRPAPPRDVAPLAPTYEPRSTPPRDVAPLPPTYEPRSTPPRDVAPPPPTYEPRPAPPREEVSALEPRPAPPREDVSAFEARPAPPREEVPSFEPRPAPTRDVAPSPPTFEPRPAPPREEVSAFEPRPAPTREEVPSFEPRPEPTREEVSAFERRPAAGETASVLSATELIALADRLASVLRVFKGDAGLALWRFNHAGGEAAVQSFAKQVQRVQRYPDDPMERDQLIELAPQAASLLQAATLLANVVSSLGPHTPSDNEPRKNASDAQPITRP